MITEKLSQINYKGDKTAAGSKKLAEYFIYVKKIVVNVVSQINNKSTIRRFDQNGVFTEQIFKLKSLIERLIKFYS